MPGALIRPLPWEVAHPCHPRPALGYRHVPMRDGKGLWQVCGHCNRKWEHPDGPALVAVWLSGYRTARQHFDGAAEQLSVSVLGVIPT